MLPFRKDAPVLERAGDGEFNLVHDVAVDPADSSIYTVEIKNWRVQKWVKR